MKKNNPKISALSKQKAMTFSIAVFAVFFMASSQNKVDTILYTAKWVQTYNPKIMAFYAVKEYDKQGKGLANYYTKSGILYSRQMEINDIKNGPCKWYYENGEIHHEADYKSDFPQGEQKWYSPTGELERIEIWNSGKIIENRLLNPKKRLEESEKIDISEFPDQEANFVGGLDSLASFISNNVVYPKESIEMNEQGKVYVSFVVETDGSISTIVIERGVSPLLDAETIRLIESMPPWIPGRMGNGQLARTRCRIPINFSLDNDEEKKTRKKMKRKK